MSTIYIILNKCIYCLTCFFKLAETLNRCYHLLIDIVGPSNTF